MKWKPDMRDRDVRKALHSRVLRDHHGDPNTLVLNELGLRHGRCRVDVAVVNGSLHGYELKSDMDTLERLSFQVETYGKVLDRATLVVGERHAEKAIPMLPDWWGIKVASLGARGGISFSHYRPASLNAEIDPVAVAELLWQSEVVAILADCGIKGAMRHANYYCSLVELFQHEKGELQGERVRLRDWQCFILCNVFGWVDKLTKFRRFLEALILIPRGNGKSPMGAWVANLLAWFDGERGSEVYCAATGIEQAHEVFRPAKAIVEMAGLEQSKGIEVQVKSMVQASTRSRMLPVIGRPKDGKMPHGVINDEYHEQPDDRLYESFKRGMNKRRQSLMFNISTAGDTVEGPCHAMCETVVMLLQGQYEDDRLFGIIYDVDDDVKWDTLEAVKMSNPNYGVSVMEEPTLRAMEEARRKPEKQMGFRTKNENFWAQQASGVFNMDAWDKCRADITLDQFLETPCYLSSDLSFTSDLTATVKLFVWMDEDGRRRYAAFAQGYLPEKQVQANLRPYFTRWAASGHIKLTPGAMIFYKEIEDDIVADVERFQVVMAPYDSRYAGQMMQNVNERTGVDILDVPPRPMYISPAIKELYAAIEDGRFQHDGNPFFRWAIGNVKAPLDRNGEYRMPEKGGGLTKKIDPAYALLLSMTQARLHEGGSMGYTTADDLFFV